MSFWALILTGCAADEISSDVVPQETLQISTSVENFEGEAITRTLIDGTAFENGDKIKLKIICPNSNSVELGESTYGASFDGFWLLKWNTDKWTTLTKDDGYDINGDYSPSASPDIYARYLAQPTMYVFTAQTWSEEQIFLTGNGIRVEQYSNVFHADQSKVENYKASDLMWGQTIMQTGSYNIHLSFKHVMSALKITIVDSDSNSPVVLNNPVMTIDGMPDIDQCEVVVGDYYAIKGKDVNSTAFGYKNKHQCTGKNENGVVIGVAQINSSNATTSAIDVSKKSTYMAYKVDNKTYRLIVPPCTLNEKATLWLRDGDKRYSLVLEQKEFKAGVLYNITMKLK